MIGDVLALLKNQLNGYLTPTSTNEDLVVFLDGDQETDSASFKTNAITVLLYHIEQETASRQGDPYVRTLPNGTVQRVKPDICLNLYVLFVAKFKNYQQGLHYLSHVISFFQSHKLFNRQNAPELTADVMELGVDLVTLTAQQQHELWGMLRACYWPSLAYKVRAVAFHDKEGMPLADAVSSIERHFKS
ncbi:MAG: DUF4255 domain-containing protein [Candidatus Methylumidiphilus alinenensis]|uniref:DUF4255 domain-containing protein n=1 Tax=Candidatus Methylumidiphilus alinenensis TaxID=2202197 RepID=A0A2W4RYL0_9GAMM|nr:MAG: DUF4255 domain-containing protein [Candidatus Methylumidiphilus alinenensis]